MRYLQTASALCVGVAVAVLAVALAHGAAPAQVRLAWTLQQGPHVLAIPGTSNLDHLTENVAAGVLRLSPGEMDRLLSLGHQGA